MSSPSAELVKRLRTLPQTEALATLAALEKKRKDDGFIRYWTPQPQQKTHFGEFTPEVKVFGILGGNRSGKTEEGAFIALAWCLGKDYFRDEPAWEWVKDLPIPAGPKNVWVVGLDFPTLRDVIWREKLRFGRNHPPLLPKDAQVVTKVSDGDYQIFFANGSILTGKSADSGREKFQGASVDLVWIDEEPEVDIFDECWQRTADCAGKILLTLTPLTDISSGVRTPWVFDLYEESQAGRKDIKFVSLNVLLNPYVPDDEKRRLIDKWAGHYEEKARLYGEFIQRSGLVYNLWKPKLKPEGHLVAPFKIPRDWKRIVSIDPAATGTTAAVWAAVEPGTNHLYLYREYYDSNKIVSDHAKNILAMTSEAIDIWLIDPKWGAQRNNESHKTGQQLYRENGIPVRLAEVNYEDYGMNASREYMAATLDEKARHPKMWVFSDLKNFRHEVEHYVWDFFQKGDQKGLSKDKPLKRNDHLMNAFQYLCCMKPRGGRAAGMPTDPESKRQFAALNSYT